VIESVDDLVGGTRITQALHEFNLKWARRVMYGSPTVLLVTDGLEHGDTEPLSREASGCRSPADAWSGSIRCCATKASSRAPAE